eukprot:6196712-Prymnesium_polylepis.2
MSSALRHATDNAAAHHVFTTFPVHSSTEMGGCQGEEDNQKEPRARGTAGPRSARHRPQAPPSAIGHQKEG